MSTATSFDRSVEIGNNGENTRLIVCRACSCKILKPSIGLFDEHEKSIPDAHGAPREVSNEWWKLDDMFKFENIGFTRAHGASPDCRLLCCAQCEVEPIGYTADMKSFFINACLVLHTDS